MYPPKPTNNPYELLNNLWSSLSRAGNAPDGGHWSQEATVEPASTGYKTTLKFAGAMDSCSWGHASKYIRSYARASHWKVHDLVRRKSHIELVIEHSPPKLEKKQRPKQRPASQKTS